MKHVIQGERSFAKVWTGNVEDSALQQIHNLTALPFIHRHVAIMPDVHAGYGSTVGSVIPTRGAIIPAAVGVDIGCGMMAYRLNIRTEDLPDSLSGIRSAIEAVIPHGRTDNGGRNDRGAWGDVPSVVADGWHHLEGDERFRRVVERHPKLMKGNVNTGRHLGTLGTGNHFIEVCLDENGAVWVMLHSGSRGIGNRIGTYFIQLAKDEMKRWFINVPDADLSYLAEGSEYFNDYRDAVGWAQDFARANRELMMTAALAAISEALDRRPLEIDEYAVNCHHNYVAKENHFGANVWVTRKGAVRARSGDLGIIPGSMGQRSYIVRGKGNPESFHSCSHGAGRTMSRTKARKTFTVADLEAQTAGVECRKDDGVLDEIPAAYKSIDEVMENQRDLVDIVATLKQVVCVKG